MQRITVWKLGRLQCVVSVGSRPEEGRSPENRDPATVATLRLILTRGFTHEVREKFCKAFKAKCKKCDRIGHFTENCVKGKGFPKKVKVSVLTTEEKEAESAVPPASESSAVLDAPAAALNSVE